VHVRARTFKWCTIVPLGTQFTADWSSVDLNVVYSVLYCRSLCALTKVLSHLPGLHPKDVSVLSIGTCVQPKTLKTGQGRQRDWGLVQVRWDQTRRITWLSPLLLADQSCNAEMEQFNVDINGMHVLIAVGAAFAGSVVRFVQPIR
jgi:hypothetical protein